MISQIHYFHILLWSFFSSLSPFTLHCYASSYPPSPPHFNHSAVTTNNSSLQCSGCKVISSLSSESATSVKAPHWAARLWFSGVIYHWELSNSKTNPISWWTDWAADYYKRRSTFCCFFWTQSPLCRWFDTHFSASTFISSSGCCCLGGIEG